MRVKTIGLSLFVLALSTQPTVVNAQVSQRSDAIVLSHLLGEQDLSSDVTRIRSHAAALPLEDRYQFLREAVLPNTQHSGFRVQGDFTPSYPVPPVAVPDPIDDRRIANARQSGQKMVSTGGLVVSPAFDLVVAAGELGRLEELKAEVEKLTPQGEVQERCRLALLMLIALEQHDDDTVFKGLEELNRRLTAQTFPDLANRWAETLVAYRVVDSETLREPALLLIRRLIEGQVRAGRNHGPESWDRLITALFGRIRHRSSVESGKIDAVTPQLSQWVPVVLGDSTTRARGFPCAQWQLDGGAISRLSSNYDECLLYQIPLQGDYTVEFDIGAFDYHDTAAVLAGHLYDLQWGLKQLDVRGVRSRLRVATIDPPLSKIDDWKRIRMVVSGHTVSVHINGREVLQDQIRPESFPWIGMRTPHYSYGQMKNFRVSGSPMIPESISLVTDAELPGWKAYMRDTMDSPAADWKFDPALAPQGGLQGRHKTEIRGMLQESLLRYVRPMAEDGSIEYEFFHEPGQIQVHPCLDRKSFLIEPTGVVIHWVGDDLWDQSGLDPLNRHAEGDQLHSGKLPLQDGWNSMRLQLIGDTVTLSLNGEDIYRGEIEITNDRTFGFFHYADQTEVRVRNVEWRGSWPKSLPLPQLQELHDERLVQLETTQPRGDAFEFDFREDNWQEKFSFKTYIEGGRVETSEQGLVMSQPRSKSFQDSWLLPMLTVSGDFDMVAEFQELEITGPEYCGGGLYLTTIFEDQFIPHCKTHWGLSRSRNEPDRGHVEAEIDTFHPETRIRYEGHQSQDGSAGKLRLSRRGKRVSFMVAEAGSNAYRIVHEEDVSDRPLRSEGIRIGTGLWSDDPVSGSIKVTWTRFSIRADLIRVQKNFRTQHQLADQDFRLRILGKRTLQEYLNEQPLPPVVLQDQFKNSVPNEKFAVVGGAWDRNVKVQPNGLEMNRNGGNGYLKYWLVPQLQLSGDFDVTASYEQLQHETKPGVAGGVHLYVGLDDEWNTECRLFRKVEASESQDSAYVEASIFEHEKGQTQQDYPTKLKAQFPAGRLRFLRRGEWLLYLFADGTSAQPEWQLVSAQKVGTAPTRLNALRLDVEHQGEGRTSVVWTNLTVRAEAAFGPAVERQLNIAQLDEQREQLPAKLELNFARTDPEDQQFTKWPGGSGTVRQTENGLHLQADGQDGWTALGYMGNRQLTGDFDVSLELSDLEFDVPFTGDSTVGLEILFPGKRYQAVQTQFHVTPNGIRGGWVVTALSRPDGTIHYEELQSIRGKGASLLRIARRGQIAYLMFQESPAAPVQILQRIQLQDEPVTTQRFQMLVHAGGQNKKMAVVFRRLTMAAEKIDLPLPANRAIQIRDVE